MQWPVDSVVQHSAQKGIADPDLAVVLDEAQLSELVHEEIKPGPCRANHFIQRKGIEFHASRFSLE